MEKIIEKSLSEITQYPTDWIYGYGKTQGKVDIKSKNVFYIKIREGKSKIIFSDKVFYNNDEREEKFEKASKILYDECLKNKLIKNRIRFISEDEIEVELSHGQIMKTNKKYIDLIEKNLIFSVSNNSKLHKYYAMIYFGKNNEKNVQKFFHTYIMGGKMTDHINRNTMDNRLCNLRATTYEENNDNKSFSAYATENSSGYRGVRLDKQNNAYTAMIITNKIKENGEKTYITKSFSIQKYGEEEAKKLAIEYRQKMVTEFNNDKYDAFDDNDKKEKQRKRIKELDDNGNIIKLECKACEQILLTEKFPKSDKSTGYSSRCYSCKNEHKKTWNKKKINERKEKNKKEMLEQYNAIINKIKDSDEIIDDGIRDDESVNSQKMKEIVTKKCIECNETLTLKQFERREKSTDGHKNKCKICVNKKRIEVKKDNKNTNFRTREFDDNNKLIKLSCNKCDKIQTVDNYVIQIHNEQGEDTYYPTCKNCHNKQRREKTEQKNKISEVIEKKNNKVCTECKDDKLYPETMKMQREKIQEIITEKTCKKCSIKKLVDSFNKKNDAKDGLQPYCRDCINKIKKDKKNQ
jgi:hypothetical protein